MKWATIQKKMESSMNRLCIVLAIILTTTSASAWAQGDAGRGERMFRACAPCHSLEPNRNMTGPSLAELWNRQAGGLASFNRYSPAVKQSGIIWDDKSLDEWIRDPGHFIPGNTMTFPGIRDRRHSAALLDYIK